MHDDAYADIKNIQIALHKIIIQTHWYFHVLL